MSQAAQPRSRGPLQARFTAVAVVLALGSAVTGFMYQRATQSEARRIRSDFDGAAENHAVALARVIEFDLLLLESLRSWYSAADAVGQREFHAFVAPLLGRGKGLRALEWVPRVRDAERAAHEAALQRAGAQGYQIRERPEPGRLAPAQRRAEYFPVSAFSPGEPPDPVLGFDLASDPTRREAIERCAETGLAVATGRVTLVREPRGGHGFLVFTPLYESAVALGSASERRQALRGVIMAVFRIPDLVAGALASLQPLGIDVRITDQSAPAEAQELFVRATGPEGGSDPLELRHVSLLTVGGRRWSVESVAGSDFTATRRTAYPAGVLGAGLLVTGLLAAYLARQKQAEQALRESEQRYRLLFEGNPLPMLVYDPDTLRILAANVAAQFQYGYSREELLRLGIGDLAIPDDPHFASFLATRHDPRPDLLHIGLRQQRRRDGSVLDVDLTSLVVRYAGRPARLILTPDVTAERQAAAERARLQSAIEHAAAEWQRSFDAVDLALLVFDRDLRVLRLNRAATALLGDARGFQATLGRDVHDFGTREPWAAATSALERAVSTRVGTTAEAREAASGRAWSLSVSLATAPDADAGLRLILVIADVTRLVELQESLRRTETMAVLGSLVAGVAHEVRNPLFSISATIDMLDLSYGKQPEYAEYAGLLRAQIQRLRQLTQGLLDYGRPSSLRLAPTAVAELVRTAERHCAALAASRGVQVMLELAPELPLLEADAGQLQQAIDNLLANAIQHAPAGSVVRVTVAAPLPPALVIQVEDTGPGVAEADLPRLFAPFFTRRQGGTGLGLSIVQRVVEAHRGRVSAANRRDGGAVFSITIPLAPVPPAEVPDARLQKSALPR